MIDFRGKKTGGIRRAGSKGPDLKAGVATVLTGAALAAMGAPAHAEDQLAQTVRAPVTVVTASRIPLKPRQVGSAVTVITAEEIERKQARFVSDVLREVPGVSVSRTGPFGGTTAVRIRGGESDHTLVIIDGIEVNDPSNGSTYDFSKLRAQDIERIEVLRGPQSSLWGSDSIGGVVNIVTKRGEGAPKGYVTGEVGNFRTGQAAGGLRGGGENYSLAFDIERFGTDGVSSADEDLGNEEDDGYDQDTASFRGSVQPIENFGIDLVGRYTNSRLEFDGFPATDANLVTETVQRYGKIDLTYDLFDGDWTHRVGAAYTHDRDGSVDQDNLAFGFPSHAVGTKIKYDYETTFRFDTPSVANADHALTFLAEQERERMEASFISLGEIKTENESAAGEYNLGLFDALFLSASVRFDKNDRFEDETTHRFTAAYVLDETATRFHGSYGTGVKNPTLTELFGFGSTFIGNPDLEPEKSKGFDIGVEQRFWNDRARVDVTYFHNRIEDLINGFVPAGGANFTSENVDGTSRIRGVEVTGDVALTEDLDLAASYTYSNGTDADGAQLIRRPKHIASVNANWAFDGGRGNLNVGVDYNGDMLDSVFPGTVRLNSYGLVNIAVSYEVIEGLKVHARGENVLDEDYQEVSGFGTPGAGVFAGATWEF